MEWTPAVITSSIIAVIFYLAQKALEFRLKASIESEYNQKLAELESELREKEELFRQQIEKRRTEIDSLRSQVFSGLTEREKALYPKRIEAVEAVWGAVQKLGPAKTCAMYMLVIDFDKAAEIAEFNQETRNAFELMKGDIDIKNLGLNEVSRVRPFVSEIAWALYSAYVSIITFPVMQITALSQGISKDIFKNTDFRNVLIKALPEKEEQIRTAGANEMPHLFFDLENEILKELRSYLSGRDIDESTLERAHELMKATESSIKPEEKRS